MSMCSGLVQATKFNKTVGLILWNYNRTSCDHLRKLVPGSSLQKKCLLVNNFEE